MSEIKQSINKTMKEIISCNFISLIPFFFSLIIAKNTIKFVILITTMQMYLYIVGSVIKSMCDCPVKILTE